MLNMVEQLTSFNSPVKVHGNTINEILSRQEKVQLFIQLKNRWNQRYSGKILANTETFQIKYMTESFKVFCIKKRPLGNNNGDKPHIV